MTTKTIPTPPPEHKFDAESPRNGRAYTFGTGYGNRELPDHELEQEVLAAQSSEDDPGVRTLADLVVMLLAPNGMAYQDTHPEACETLEQAIIENTARELKCLTVALSHEDASESCGAFNPVSFTADDAVMMLHATTKRLTAAYELSRRLREARWGHPCYGGGEVEEQPSGGAADAESEVRQ